MSYSSRSRHPPKLSRPHVLNLCKVPNPKCRGICLYGSQVYGTQNKHSDYDFIVLACTMHRHKEFNDGTYNVHIKTPDAFYDELMNYSMSALECIYAPKFAQLQPLVFNEYIPFEINNTKLKRKALAESHNSWNKAKRMINDGDMYRGTKSIWHSLKILLFADQILNEGVIYDFSEANHYWNDINDSNAIRWNDFKRLLLYKKIDLEQILKAH